MKQSAKTKCHPILLMSASTDGILWTHFIHVNQHILGITAAHLGSSFSISSHSGSSPCLCPHLLAQKMKEKECLSPLAQRPPSASKVGYSHFHCKCSDQVPRSENWQAGGEEVCLYLNWGENTGPELSGGQSSAHLSGLQSPGQGTCAKGAALCEEQNIWLFQQPCCNTMNYGWGWNTVNYGGDAGTCDLFALFFQAVLSSSLPPSAAPTADYRW